MATDIGIKALFFGPTQAADGVVNELFIMMDHRLIFSLRVSFDLKPTAMFLFVVPTEE